MPLTRLAPQVDLSPHAGRVEKSPSCPDRRLEGQRGVPWKMDPGVLRYFGDEGTALRPPLWLGVDSREMGVGQHLTHQRAGLARVDEVIDDQQPLAGASAQFC